MTTSQQQVATMPAVVSQLIMSERTTTAAPVNFNNPSNSFTGGQIKR